MTVLRPVNRTAACALVLAVLSTGLHSRSLAAAPPSIVPPRRLDTSEVPYPSQGQGEASVVLVLTVDATGRVSDVVVRDGSPPFTDAAVAAVRRWRFTPATRDDEPIAARITANIGFHVPPHPEASSRPPSPPVERKSGAPPVEVSVKGEREEPSTIHIPRSETQLVPGAFGDPFKIVEALPGMAPWLSGLPYYYVRGSPPENVGYFVDGIRVPLLFHVGPGPSTIAPALVDSVDLFPGAYPARYGRYAGAVIAGETTPPQTDRLRGEFGARLYDANAFVETPFDDGKGTLLAAARYAYTGPLISIIVPKYALGYCDYQLRASHRLDDQDTLTLFAFGAHDELHYLGQPTFSIEYHRVDLRYDHSIPGGNVRVAWTFNDDDTLTALQTNTGAGTSATLRGPGWRLRTELDERVGSTARLRAGADIGATRYTVDDYPPIQGFPGAAGPHTDVEGGLYGDVVWRPTRQAEIVPGFRFDGYRNRGETVWAPQPRLATRMQLLPAVAWVSSFGTAHQEPTEEVFVPAKLPNPIDQASQTTYQLSEGAEIRLPSGIQAHVAGFYSREIATHILGTAASEIGDSGGLEVFVRREFTRRLGGFISYTLSRTVATVNGATQRVDWDRTHVVSVVLSYDLGAGWRIGSRLFFESGRPFQPVCVKNCSGTAGEIPVMSTPPGNLPVFWRLDGRLEKRWTFSGGQWLTASLECFNIFDRGEPTGDQYVPGQGLEIVYQSPIILPSIGLEGGL
ncbi:MAG TPA: TonB family protein [Polyangiaceae bacterium]|nr:TonB family protein [Polyangiaceae bacterium]